MCSAPKNIIWYLVLFTYCTGFHGLHKNVINQLENYNNLVVVNVVKVVPGYLCSHAIEYIKLN